MINNCMVNNSRKTGVKQGYTKNKSLENRIIQGFWVFDQSIDSPQVHKKNALQSETLWCIFCCSVGKSNQLGERLFGQGRTRSGGRRFCVDGREAETDSTWILEGS